MAKYLVMTLMDTKYKNGFIFENEDDALEYAEVYSEHLENYALDARESDGKVTISLSDGHACVSSIIALKDATSFHYEVKYKKNNDNKVEIFPTRKNAVTFIKGLLAEKEKEKKWYLKSEWKTGKASAISLLLIVKNGEKRLELNNSDMRFLLEDYPTFAKKLWGKFDEEKSKKAMRKVSPNYRRKEKGVIDIIIGLLLVVLGVGLNIWSSDNYYVVYGPFILAAILLVMGIGRLTSPDNPEVEK